MPFFIFRINWFCTDGSESGLQSIRGTCASISSYIIERSSLLENLSESRVVKVGFYRWKRLNTWDLVTFINTTQRIIWLYCKIKICLSLKILFKNLIDSTSSLRLLLTSLAVRTNYRKVINIRTETIHPTGSANESFFLYSIAYETISVRNKNKNCAAIWN